MAVWHEDDAFWEAFGPVMFTEDRWRAAPTEVEAILDLLRLPPSATILDLGCGVGRHALELARRGYQVTGVDRTAAYLAEAQDRAAKEGLPDSFVAADMREFVRPGAFDAVLSLYTSFSYFEDPEDNLRVLENVADSLKPGGQFLLQMNGKEVLARIFQERDWREQDGMYFLQERSVSKDWSWMNNRWILIAEGRAHESQVGHWIYSASELVEMLLDCGFADVDVYGDLDGNPYDHTARQLITVAKTAT
ncbi:MAG: class I SAM-dependent methyltransferase [Anaerolineae bacterium]|nr:class I SAM-dependent methyltransferase [Anaerolineae bacterium]